MSIVFDELSTETKVVHCNLVVFKKGSSNVMDITDCDCATKNLRSHLVLGRITIVCDNAAFDT